MARGQPKGHLQSVGRRGGGRCPPEERQQRRWDIVVVVAIVSRVSLVSRIVDVRDRSPIFAHTVVVVAVATPDTCTRLSIDRSKWSSDWRRLAWTPIRRSAAILPGVRTGERMTFARCPISLQTAALLG